MHESGFGCDFGLLFKIKLIITYHYERNCEAEHGTCKTEKLEESCCQVIANSKGPDHDVSNCELGN